MIVKRTSYEIKLIKKIIMFILLILSKITELLR
jgi:hypothetical protein